MLTLHDADAVLQVLEARFQSILEPQLSAALQERQGELAWKTGAASSVSARMNGSFEHWKLSPNAVA